MANKDLQSEPHNAKDKSNWWWYEEPAGIYIQHKVTDEDGNYSRHSSTLIKWTSIRAALRRKDRR